MENKNIRMGDLLVESGMITQDQLSSALQIQKESGGKKLGDILLDLEIISEKQLLSVLQKKLNVPVLEMDSVSIPNDVLKLVSADYAKNYNIIPIRLRGNTLVIATNDPLAYSTLNELGLNTGRNIETVLATKQEIETAIDRYYSRQEVDNIATTLNTSGPLIDLENEAFAAVENRVGNVPIVKFINTILEQGFLRRASDIHIEVLEESLRIRYRIDGDLVEIAQLNISTLGAMVTRIKIMAGMDIAERRVPLDGRFSLMIAETEVSVRVSSMPTVYGEKLVLRLLADNKNAIFTLKQLGIGEENYLKLKRAIKNPNGIIYVTGPTGSGKTTTLYSVLNEISTAEINTISIEDPVEKVIPGVNQTQINEKAGLTFAAGLRAALRQDPDKIMIGEIRDKETADIASRAAITGHLVFASLHTNDAASTYVRLDDIGVEPYIIASSVIAVVAQRLVKLICPHCKQEFQPNEDDFLFMNHLEIPKETKTYYGKGCARCNFTGHIGRTAIYEVVLTDNNIRLMIMDKKKSKDIEDYLKTKKHQFLLSEAISLLKAGETSLKQLSNISYLIE